MAATNEETAVRTESQAGERDGEVETPSLRESLSVEEFRDKLAFDGSVQGYPTTHDPIIRDTPELLIYANRRRNADKEWVTREIVVIGDRINFAQSTVERADIAAIMVEVFNPDDLTIDDEYTQQSPIKQGVPTAVAVDGEPAIAAWLFRQGVSREQVAHEMGVTEATVDEYLSQFRQRGTGIPDDMEVPRYGDPMPEVPERFNPDPNGQTTLEELADLS